MSWSVMCVQSGCPSVQQTPYNDQRRVDQWLAETAGWEVGDGHAVCPLHRSVDWRSRSLDELRVPPLRTDLLMALLWLAQVQATVEALNENRAPHAAAAVPALPVVPPTGTAPAAQVRRGFKCSICMDSDLGEAFGHTRGGHRTVTILRRVDITTLAELAEAMEADAQAVLYAEGVGDIGREMIELAMAMNRE